MSEIQKVYNCVKNTSTGILFLWSSLVLKLKTRHFIRGNDDHFPEYSGRFKKKNWKAGITITRGMVCGMGDKIKACASQESKHVVLYAVFTVIEVIIV